VGVIKSGVWRRGLGKRAKLCKPQSQLEVYDSVCVCVCVCVCGPITIHLFLIFLDLRPLLLCPICNGRTFFVG
jgi:hypothetical protein